MFKTHLDVGYTDLSSVVTQQYITEFIPKALDVADKLRAENANEKYVWTTGVWLIWNLLGDRPDARAAASPPFCPVRTGQYQYYPVFRLPTGAFSTIYP